MLWGVVYQIGTTGRMGTTSDLLATSPPPVGWDEGGVSGALRFFYGSNDQNAG